MERFDVSSIKINHLAFKLSKSGEQRLIPNCRPVQIAALTLEM